MSTFKGTMREYGFISIDRFDGYNLQSTAYFLSHCHKDHMAGLGSPNFIYRLHSNSQLKLYCSKTTKDLLLNEDDIYQGIQKLIVPLDIDTPTIIPIPERHSVKIHQKVTVTLLHAGHCPGSVMFLFEGEEGCALYTGDFRMQEGDIKRFSHLHSGDRPKVIDSLYIDTTFFVPQFYYIPSREDILETIINEVQEWIGQSPYHVILIRYRAGIGYEHLFVQLSRRFNTKIHFSDAKFAQYQAVQELKEEAFATKDPNSTQIHACGWKVSVFETLQVTKVIQRLLKVELLTIAKEKS